MKNNKQKSAVAVKSTLAGPFLPIATLPALAAILTLGVLIYSNSFDCSFHFDDGSNITEQPLIRNFWDFSSWWNIQSTRQLGFGSSALTYYFFGYDVWGWHLFNLLIHVGAAFAVWRLTALLFRTPVLKSTDMAAQASSIALAAALLFVAHPLATQSVTYIVQRLAAQAALFYMLAVGLYVQARLSDVRKPAAWFSYAGAILAGVCAMLTKENAYTLPLAVLLVEIYFFQSERIGRLLSNKRFLLTASGLLLIFLKVLYDNLDNITATLTLQTGEQINAYNYMMTQFTVIWRYIRLLFIPLGQNLEHQVAIAQSFFELRTFAGFLGLIALFGLGLFLFRKNRLVSFGIVWFFLTQAIESSFLPIADLMFEHRTYLPSFGFVVALSAGVLYPLYQKNGQAARMLFFGLLACYSVLTYARNLVWKTPETLWSDVIKKAPASRAYNNRGAYYLEKKEYEQARADFASAIQLNPLNVDAFRNMAKVQRAQGELAQAIENLTRAISLKSRDADAYLTRGDLYFKSGDYANALEDAEKAIALSPTFQQAYLNKAATLTALSRYEESLNASARALALNPGNAETYFSRGNAYRLSSRLDSAIISYSLAIERDSSVSIYYNNRGIAKAQKGDLAAAVTDFSQALARAPNDLSARMNRSGCYLRLQDWEKARADLDQVLSVNPNYPGAQQNKAYLLSKTGIK